MTIEYPSPEQLPQLLQLWKAVFGEWNGFWETFLETGFSLRRCRCILEDGEIAAALTWLDCACAGETLAYIYAVMTAPKYRGMGLCRRLMADTHALLKQQGYAAAILVPAEDPLRDMYRAMGYETCTRVSEFSCEAAIHPLPLRAIGPEEFARKRRELLPPDAVLQEGESLTFLSRQAQFYAGDGVLLAAYSDEETLTAMELLGSKDVAPGIVRALDSKKGSFRCPGDDIPFAMWYPLRENIQAPVYFAFAFD